MSKNSLINKPLNSLSKRVFTALILFFCLTQFTQSQELESKANYIFNFIKYINWSETQREGDFTIGVVGKTAQANALRDVCNGKKFGYQNIVVKEFAKANKIAPCQVIFVCDNAFFDLLYQKVILYGGGKDFLIITEEPNALNFGSVINFYMKNNKVRFEISEDNAKSLNISISTKLLMIAE